MKDFKRKGMYTLVYMLCICFQMSCRSHNGMVQAKEIVLKEEMVLMGSLFDITVVARDSALGRTYIQEAVNEIVRIENLLSPFRESTPLSKVNRLSDSVYVSVPLELLELVRQAQYFSENSEGAFDITTASMDRIWRFDGTMDSLPTSQEVKQSVRLVDYKSIVMDTIQQAIKFRKKGVKIGFGSIGKGYAADMARKKLQAQGVSGGIINASGDMAIWGTAPRGRSWRIGVANPFNSEAIRDVLELSGEVGIATSGDYHKYVEFDSIRYSHIIDPRTGYPAQGLVSVTVVGSSATVANGLSTSLMVLGVEKGRYMMKKYPEYQAIAITDDGEAISLGASRFSILTKTKK